MSALLTPSDINKVTSESENAGTVVIQPRLDDVVHEHVNTAKDSNTPHQPSLAVNGYQPTNTIPQIDIKPYRPTGFQIENVPLDDNPRLKVSCLLMGSCYRN